MSLKGFHLFFIAMSVLLAFGFGAWGIQSYNIDKDPLELGLGIGAIVFGMALIFYSMWFIKKAKRLHLGEDS